MFFVEEEGTASSFRGMAEVIETRGLPSSLYIDRGSHYWLTPEAGEPPRVSRRVICLSQAAIADSCSGWS